MQKILFLKKIFLSLHYKNKKIMDIKNNVKKKYLNEYKKVLTYTPYDEFLIELYENSKPHFNKTKNGKLVLAKRKKYDNIVKEYINEINDNFTYYLINSEDTLEKINNTISGEISDFSVFDYEKIIELATKISDNSWLDDDTIIINDDSVKIV